MMASLFTRHNRAYACSSDQANPDIPLPQQA